MTLVSRIFGLICKLSAPCATIGRQRLHWTDISSAAVMSEPPANLSIAHICTHTPCRPPHVIYARGYSSTFLSACMLLARAPVRTDTRAVCRAYMRIYRSREALALSRTMNARERGTWLRELRGRDLAVDAYKNRALCSLISALTRMSETRKGAREANGARGGAHVASVI